MCAPTFPYYLQYIFFYIYCATLFMSSLVFALLSSSTAVSSCLTNFCNASMSLPICSQLLERFDSIRLLFAFIIDSISPSSVLVSSTSTLTAPVGDNRFFTAFPRSSPIAILFPDAT